MLLHFDYSDQTDDFDRLPDVLILLIFNQVSDIKTLTRCLAVSKRFNSLVPEAENLLVKVDCVISSDTDESFILNILKSVLQSLQGLISSKRLSVQPRCCSSPAEILRGFEKIKWLELELPSGDLKLEKGTVIRWKAEFGKTLKSCVMLAFCTGGDREVEDEHDDIDFSGGGLKVRVVWTISALIAASARHYLLHEVIREHKNIESLVLKDKEGEGTVAMNKKGLEELRVAGEEEGGAEVCTVGWRNRITVPAVRMRMRRLSRVDVNTGLRMRGATLVVIKPTKGSETATTKTKEMEEEVEDKGLALGVFGGVFEEAVVELLKRPSYVLEMNSF